MNHQLTTQTGNDDYDPSSEDNWLSLARDFYSRKLRSFAVLVWVWSVVFVALAAWSAFRFFGADEVRGQIIYAVLFLCGIYGVGLMKVFAWEIVHRHSIKREVKRLELRIVELTAAIQGTTTK